MTTHPSDRSEDDRRFAQVFAHLAAVTAYARRRGSSDADGIAAETMTIAWRRLEDVPRDNPLPWLYATARNLVFSEARAARRVSAPDAGHTSAADVRSLDPAVTTALRALSHDDREALLLIAWEDLTPAQAAAAVGTTAVAFRVRLLRARRRFRVALAAAEATDPFPLIELDVEGT
jgi:DNA-directed RNA polymerase specialized sigma24 family protein